MLVAVHGAVVHDPVVCGAVVHFVVCEALRQNIKCLLD